LIGISKQAVKDPNFDGSMCQGNHTKTGTPVWQSGREGQGLSCAGKATLSSRVLWQTSWPESLGLTARQQTYEHKRQKYTGLKNY
jgi:hypothetical protein